MKANFYFAVILLFTAQFGIHAQPDVIKQKITNLFLEKIEATAEFSLAGNQCCACCKAGEYVYRLNVVVGKGIWKHHCEYFFYDATPQTITEKVIKRLNDSVCASCSWAFEKYQHQLIEEFTRFQVDHKK